MDRRISAGNERDFEKFLGKLLRVGVLISGALVITGGIIYLIRNGTHLPEYGKFRGEPPDLLTIFGIAEDLEKFQGHSIIQMGLLLLILTPVMRVFMSIYGFVRERDWVYTVTTLFVFAMLLFSLLGGHP